MPEPKTLTAPMAVIKINGYASGYMRTVRCTETIQRGDVKGIGNLTDQEVPAVAYKCQLQCDFFFISLKRPEVQAIFNRSGSVKDFLNTLALGGETPIQIHLYKKTKLTTVNNLVTEVDNEGETIAVIKDYYPESQTFDITENQVSGINISGRYLTPVCFNNG